MTGPINTLRTRLAADRPEPRLRLFLRALAEEIDLFAGSEARDTLLRKTGHRLARLMPLPAVGTMDGLEIEMNDRLAALGWGSAHLDLREEERCLVIAHAFPPRIGAAGDPPGTWFAAMLAGLYETWVADQPGGDPSLTAERQGDDGPEMITLRLRRL